MDREVKEQASRAAANRKSGMTAQGRKEKQKERQNQKRKRESGA